MINWNQFQEFFFLGAMGGLSIEILRLYELKNKLHYKKYKVLYRSYLFWGVSILFIFISGFLSWAMNENNPNVTVWQLVFSGMGMSALAKKSGEAIVSKDKLHAGEARIKINLRDLFI